MGGGNTQNVLNNIANALLQPAMTLSGAGRQEGGVVMPSSPPGPPEYPGDPSDYESNRGLEGYDANGNLLEPVGQIPGYEFAYTDPGWVGDPSALSGLPGEQAQTQIDLTGGQQTGPLYPPGETTLPDTGTTATPTGDVGAMDAAAATAAPSRYWYDPSGQGHQLPEFASWVEFYPWALQNADQWAPLLGRTPNPGNIWNDMYAAWGTYENEAMSDQRTDWANSPDWTYRTGDEGWEQGWYIPQSAGGSWTPEGAGFEDVHATTETGEQWFAGTGQGMSGDQGWLWNAQQGVFQPPGYEFAPPPEEEPGWVAPDLYDYDWVYNEDKGVYEAAVGDANPYEGGALPAGMRYNYQTGMLEAGPLATEYEQPRFTGDVPIAPPEEAAAPTDEEVTTGTTAEDLDTIDWTATGDYAPQDWSFENLTSVLDTMFPGATENLSNLMNVEAAYQFNPDEIEQTWQKTVYEPATERWFNDILPRLQEQFVTTGNIYGGERPTYVLNATADLMMGLDAELARMMSEGRTMEYNAIESMIDNRMAAYNMMSSMLTLPLTYGMGELEMTRLSDEIDAARVMVPVQFQEALANIDYTRASAADIWGQAMKSQAEGAWANDQEMIKTLVSFFMADNMQYTQMGQQLQNMYQALVNQNLAIHIGGTAQEVLENVFLFQQGDFEARLEPIYGDTWMTELANAVGQSNLVTFETPQQPAGGMGELGWFGQYLATADF